MRAHDVLSRAPWALSHWWGNTLPPGFPPVGGGCFQTSQILIERAAEQVEQRFPVPLGRAFHIVRAVGEHETMPGARIDLDLAFHARLLEGCAHGLDLRRRREMIGLAEAEI